MTSHRPRIEIANSRQSTINKLQGRIKRMEEERWAFQGTIASLEATIETMEHSVKHLEAINELYENKMKSFEGKLRSMTDELTQPGEETPHAVCISDSSDSEDSCDDSYNENMGYYGRLEI